MGTKTLELFSLMMVTGRLWGPGWSQHPREEGMARWQVVLRDRIRSMTTLSSHFYSKSLSKYFGYTKALGFFSFLLYLGHIWEWWPFMHWIQLVINKSDEVVNTAGVRAVEEGWQVKALANSVGTWSMWGWLVGVQCECVNMEEGGYFEIKYKYPPRLMPKKKTA